jgi:hypothetical protein
MSMVRSILRFAGLGPIRETLIGGVESIGDGKRKAWLRLTLAVARWPG